MRRIIVTVVIAIAGVVGLASIAVATSGGSSITPARLGRSVTASFSNVYSQQAALLGHTGVTPQSMNAKAMCDKGPGVPQSGAGTNWICLMSWTDPSVPMPAAGYGKFELSVTSNDCYTVGSPSTLVGYQTITDAAGQTVYNPAYEYDACFDPNSDNTPTGVTFPAALTITNTTANVNAQRQVTAALACGAGAGRCAGTITASVGDQSLGTVPFDMTEQATGSLLLPNQLPAGATKVTYTVKETTGVAPQPVTVPVQS